MILILWDSAQTGSLECINILVQKTNADRAESTYVSCFHNDTKYDGWPMMTLVYMWILSQMHASEFELFNAMPLRRTSAAWSSMFSIRLCVGWCFAIAEMHVMTAGSPPARGGWWTGWWGTEWMSISGRRCWSVAAAAVTLSCHIRSWSLTNCDCYHGCCRLLFRQWCSRRRGFSFWYLSNGLYFISSDKGCQPAMEIYWICCGSKENDNTMRYVKMTQNSRKLFQWMEKLFPLTTP